MRNVKQFWLANTWKIFWSLLSLVILLFLLLHRLGSLTGGLSHGEAQVALAVVGWHGLYHSVLNLPLNLLRSIVFALSPGHGQTLTRLPNAVMGGLSIISFGWLAWLWHGRRTAIMTTVLFASSAFVLHVSRYASFDVEYVWSITTMLLIFAVMNRFEENALIWYGSLVLIAFILTIPGMIWYEILLGVLLRTNLGDGWKTFDLWWQRTLSIIVPLIWLPLLVLDWTRSGQLVTWLGLPHHFAGIGSTVKHFVAVFVHLFIRGPQYPTLWLAKAPVLDAFSLAMAALGIYFYIRHLSSGRTHILLGFFALSVIFVGLQGPVSFAATIPLAYATCAMGIGYLIHEWFRIFPHNPIARNIGIILVSLAIATSAIYGLRSYFIAWPHNPATTAVFNYHR